VFRKLNINPRSTASRQEIVVGSRTAQQGPELRRTAPEQTQQLAHLVGTQRRARAGPAPAEHVAQSALVAALEQLAQGAVGAERAQQFVDVGAAETGTESVRATRAVVVRGLAQPLAKVVVGAHAELPFGQATSVGVAGSLKTVCTRH